MDYHALDHIVPGHWPCSTGPCTICYGAMDTFYRTMGHVLPGSYWTGSLTMIIDLCVMSYWAVDPIVLGYQPCATGLQTCCTWWWTCITMFILYRDIDHVVQIYVPCTTQPWKQYTMSYRALDHTVPSYWSYGTVLCTKCYQAVDTFCRTLDYELMGAGQYCTGPLTTWFKAVYHVLLVHGHALTGWGPWVTRPWTILYWVVHGCLPCATGLWIRGTVL